MHFTTLYLMKNTTLDEVNLNSIMEDFGNRFCNDCGLHTPKYFTICDWFKIGGRWCDLLKASRGIKGGVNYGHDEPTPKNCYSIVEIKDLIQPISNEFIYSVTLRSTYTEDPGRINYYLDLINNKKISGVVALIDCHD